MDAVGAVILLQRHEISRWSFTDLQSEVKRKIFDTEEKYFTEIRVNCVENTRSFGPDGRFRYDERTTMIDSVQSARGRRREQVF